MYGEKVAEASALIREFAKVDYFHYFARDPESSLEEFIAMLEQAEEKGRQSQASRIAELERQLAEASDPAVEQNHVAVVIGTPEQFGPKMAIGWLNPSSCRVGTKLYTAPQATDTGKAREAILALEPKDGNGWDYDNGFGAAIRAVAGILNPASMAGQAPVQQEGE